jgi:hypothetical protein
VYKEQSGDVLELKLPPIEGAEYLVSLLFEAGLVQQTGMGVTALSWQEIRAWLDSITMQLPTWEILTLKRLSEAYAGEYNQASDKARPAPYVFVPEDVEEEIDRVAVGSKLKALLRSYKK